MISKIIYENGREYACDDCKVNKAIFKRLDDAKRAGWAISRDRKNCYCKKCAPNHRNVGRGGSPLPLPPGWEQTKIENLG